MFNYFKDMFTKPKYMWTALDEWAVIGLVFGLLIIIGLIWISVLFICDGVKKRKNFKCKNKGKFNWCFNHTNCGNCKHYEKKSKKQEKADE